MTTKSLIKQPWHTEYCHLWFEYSDLRANYTTHGMLTPTLPAAVKTGRPLFNSKGEMQNAKALDIYIRKLLGRKMNSLKELRL